MSNIRSIFKNAVFLLSSNVISRGLGFVYVIYMVRYLGAEKYGILGFALAFCGIFTMLSDLGFFQLTIREVSRDTRRASWYLANVGTLKVFLIGLTLVLVAATVKVLGYPEATVKVVYIIFVSSVVVGFTKIVNAMLTAFERMEYVAVGMVLNNLTMLAGVMTAIRVNLDVEGFAYVYIAASVVAMLYGSFMLLRVLGSKRECKKPLIEPAKWKGLVKESILFGLSGTFASIMLYLDTVIISFFLQARWWGGTTQPTGSRLC